MFRIITFSREFGSGGGEIACLVARRLRWKLIDDPLVEEIAKRANVSPELARRFDECVDPWFHRIIKALWRGGFEGAVSRSESAAFDADEMAALWNRIIRESATLGQCVIVGRGAQCILQGRKDAFHVSVYAAIEDRCRQIQRRFPSVADARAEAHASDQRRASYVQRYFGENWKDYRLYHLVLDSAIGFEQAADAILCAAGLLKPVAEQPMVR